MEHSHDVAVRNSMTQDLVTTHPAESARSAFEKMDRRGVHHLPVIDESGQLIGLLSSRDFYRALTDESRGQGVIRSIHDLNPQMIVRDLMSLMTTNQVPTISPDADVREAARAMLDRHISALVVLEDQQLLGLITHEDLLRVLIDGADLIPGELKRVEAVVYNSPLGDVVNALNNAGI